MKRTAHTHPSSPHTHSLNELPDGTLLLRLGGPMAPNPHAPVPLLSAEVGPGHTGELTTTGVDELTVIPSL